jgi:uncharacterized membrane protein
MNTAVRVTDVLRSRRHSPTRLEGFVDASFAFAVTLLAISIGHVPASVDEMLQALRGLPAFALCFLAIARIWKAHRDWSRCYDLEDATALNLSLLLVFVVLVFVYPLRLLFSLFFAWVSHGYLVDQPVGLHSVEELRIAFEVYGIAFGAISLLFALLYRHALARAAEIGLDAGERIATRMQMTIWSAFVGLAILSALSAALLLFRDDQPLLFMVPGLVYALSGVIATAIKRHFAHRLATLEAAR